MPCFPESLKAELSIVEVTKITDRKRVSYRSEVWHTTGWQAARHSGKSSIAPLLQLLLPPPAGRNNRFRQRPGLGYPQKTHPFLQHTNFHVSFSAGDLYDFVFQPAFV